MNNFRFTILTAVGMSSSDTAILAGCAIALSHQASEGYSVNKFIGL